MSEFKWEIIITDGNLGRDMMSQFFVCVCVQNCKEGDDFGVMFVVVERGSPNIPVMFG